MKVALIADIHANVLALDAVLAHAEAAGCDVVWNLGDTLGYGPAPRQVVQRLVDLPRAIHLAGNWDEKSLRFARKPKHWHRPSSPAKLFAFQWAFSQLSGPSRRFLNELPAQRRVMVGRMRFLLVHDSPDGKEELLGPNTDPARMNELAHMADADVVLFGHTHRAWDASIDGTRFINPGSVGLAVDGDPRAAYAILDIRNDVVAVEFVRLEYDLAAVARDMRDKGLPEAFAEMLLQGRHLNAIIHGMMPSSRAQAVPVDAGDSRLGEIVQLAEVCHYDAEHSRQVTRLALRLFDELRPLHCFGEESRFLLNCAGLLHDIGWVQGQQKHHKTSRDLILQATQLPLTERQRTMVAAVARYHRKALPKEEHPLYATLQEGDRNTVCLLGGLLRLADGLDRMHTSVVADLNACTKGKTILLQVQIHGDAEEELAAAMKKSDLLSRSLDRTIYIQMVKENNTTGNGPHAKKA